ncbi:uncharacterized protein LOC133555674 [Nerophis ophidion]|uniref:uncharacterized protein LOC133555674 n=1 Tax=Nerophis ophidion TaxID=159077 RepID=UPI002ADFBBF0|nr:uncharacterized protein LOC133555674 [Nerophis ophidion]
MSPPAPRLASTSAPRPVAPTSVHRPAPQLPSSSLALTSATSTSQMTSAAFTPPSSYASTLQTSPPRFWRDAPWRHSRPPPRLPRWCPFLGCPPRRRQLHSTRRRHQTRPRWIRGHLGWRPTTSSPLRPPLTFVPVLLVFRPVGHLEAVHKKGGTVTVQTPASAARPSVRHSGHAHGRTHPGTSRARPRPAAAASCNQSPANFTPDGNDGAAFIDLDNLPSRAGL